MKVTTLIENTRATGMEHLRAEHGLSLYVEHGKRRILFDTGASGAFADNATRLGVDIEAVDMAVISHHHYDHGGGLRRFLQINQRATIYLRSPPAGDCHFKLLWMDKYIGLDQALLREHAHRFIFLTERTRAAGNAAAAKEQAIRDGNKEAAAVLGFSGAIGAYGGFFIPKSYGTSISMTGGPEMALYVFIAFYITCVAITWWFYSRRNAQMPC